MADEDDALAEAIGDLADTIEELRTTLESQRRRRRPPLRPPKPEEVLRLADEVAIPTLLAFLEANVRALKAFQRVLQAVRTGKDVHEGATDVSDRTRKRAEELRSTTLAQLEDALTDLQRAVSADELPADPEARSLLEEARALRAEVDDRLEAMAEEPTDGRAVSRSDVDGTEPGEESEEASVADGSDGAEADPATVDVDAELETLKDQFRPADADGDDGGVDGEAGDEGQGDEYGEGDGGEGDEHGAGDDGEGDGDDADGQTGSKR